MSHLIGFYVTWRSGAFYYKNRTLSKMMDISRGMDNLCLTGHFPVLSPLSSHSKLVQTLSTSPSPYYLVFTSKILWNHQPQKPTYFLRYKEHARNNMHKSVSFNLTTTGLQIAMFLVFLLGRRMKSFFFFFFLMFDFRNG